MKIIRLTVHGQEAGEGQRAIFSEFLIPVEDGGELKLRVEDVKAGARVLKKYWDRRRVGPWNACTDIMSALLTRLEATRDELFRTIRNGRPITREEVDVAAEAMLDAGMIEEIEGCG